MKHPIPERWLYWTYLRPELWRPHIRSTDGQAIYVLRPGERNLQEGPDFLHALLEVNGVQKMGDVEFHVQPEDWVRHGHLDDIRYQQVILHGVWEAPRGIPARIEKRFPHWIISQSLSVPLHEWRDYMKQLENAGAENFLSGITFPTLSVEQLRDYAFQRFYRRVDRLQSWLSSYSWEDTLFIALAEVLGYSQNKHPFRRLFQKYPPSVLHSCISPPSRSPGAYWLLLLRVGGLLPAHISHALRDIPHMQLFETRLQKEWLPILSLTDWRFSRLRPANNPYLRMAALSELLYCYQRPGLFHALLEIATERLPALQVWDGVATLLKLPFSPTLKALLQRLLKFKSIPSVGIGQQRIQKFVVNALLPLWYLWARRSENWGFGEYLLSLYCETPPMESSTLYRSLLSRVPQGALRKQLLTEGHLQQGLLEFTDQLQVRRQQRLF